MHFFFKQSEEGYYKLKSQQGPGQEHRWVKQAECKNKNNECFKELKDAVPSGDSQVQKT